MSPIDTTTGRRGLFLCALLLGLSAPVARAGSAAPWPAVLDQPDGTRVTVYLEGDEHFHWNKAVDGFPILLDDDGWWVYAAEAGDRLVGTGLRVGQVDPAALGLTKPSIPRIRQAVLRASPPQSVPGESYAASAGTLKSLVVLVNFSDLAFTIPNAGFDALFNEVGYSADGANGSVRDYFTVGSFGQLTVESLVVGPVTVSKGYAYYGAPNMTGGKDSNAQEMVQEALAALEASGFDFSTMDGDGDGWVDALDIVHAGVGQEVSGNDPDTIWSHKSGIPPVTYDGVKLSPYHTEPELRGSGSGIVRIGVICHETAHALGLPDLYDTDYSSKGAGDFCLMGSGSWNNGGITPSFPSAWCKARLGWITPTVVSSPGVYPLAQAGLSPSALKLQSAAFPSNEYFLVENRQGVSFDGSLPGPPDRGLLIWHIDDNQTNNKDETHYLVDLEEASGTQNLELNQDEGDEWDYWRAGHATVFDASSTPSNHSYAGPSLGLDVSNVSATSGFMALTIAGPWVPGIFADSDYAGTELGTWDNPFSNLAAAIAAIPSGQALGIKSNTTSETFTISKFVRLTPINGPVVIGQ